MFFTGKRGIAAIIYSSLLLIASAAVGTALAYSIAVNKNIKDMDELMASRPAIPSRLLDMHGELITEFFSDEKRDLIPITSIPKVQIQALLTREDAPFFKHTGFSLTGFFRALVRTSQYLITGKGSLQGASTITMQLAGARHADRTDISVSRKLKELWWAFQLERRFTKEEILEQYLNTVYFGHNTYGVEAASQFFFGHSAKDNTPAEAVMLVIQLAGSGLYSPIIKPDVARERQHEILNQMVTNSYISKEEAESSFNEYWKNFDWSRSATDSPYFNRLAKDKAPYFSEYIRQQIEKYLFGQQNVYRDGYTIHTTLNLDYQRIADKDVSQGLRQWNLIYQNEMETKTGYASRELVSTIDMLSIAFGIPGIRVAGALKQREAKIYFEKNVTPVMDMLSMTFGINGLKFLSNSSYNKAKAHTKMNKVETALITLGNKNGYILSMIGGSEFSRTNQFNRAVDAKVMPGSAFKPLYYSAAISSGKFTPATLIYDGPEVFISPDGTPYTPSNYAGRWSGYVLLRNALARSLNIPALKILEGIGFDAAISRSAALLGITDPEEISRTFDRVYPLGLGILSISPIQLARAYATFANRGQAVEPIAIRYIEDRDGNVIVNPERDLREVQGKKDNQVLSPQAAYIMTSLLQSTVEFGTLSYARRSVGGFDGMPMAGKTGTTQNWTDAWTVGFSPYYTTVLWIGFDKRGNSLGRYQTGATSTGPVWARYMKEIHEDLPRIDFPKPETGIVELDIDKRTGMLPEHDTPEEYIRHEVFIAGTEPKQISRKTEFEKQRDQEQLSKILNDSDIIAPREKPESSSVFTNDLFKELNLDPLYLDNSKNGSKNATSGNSNNTSGILD